MAGEEQPQIYLITPKQVELEGFEPLLVSILDTVPVACIRVDLASQDEDYVAKVCDAVRVIAHERDVPVVVTDHVALIERLGLDGVHLTDGAKSVRKLRQDLGSDPIIGTFCGASRHDGLNAGESGADYVSFGPVRETALGHGEAAPKDLFAWWSDVVEVPVVAEGALTFETAAELAQVTDFLAIGEEIWETDDPKATLLRFVKAIT